MRQQVFAITGNKIASMLADETALLFSSQHFASAEGFRAAWDKKLSLATKVEVQYDAIKSVHKDNDDADILIKYRTILGIPTNCQFSFGEARAYQAFFSAKAALFYQAGGKLNPSQIHRQLPYRHRGNAGARRF